MDRRVWVVGVRVDVDAGGVGRVYVSLREEDVVKGGCWE